MRLSTDAISRTILMDGILYPCQAIFLGPSTPVLPVSLTPGRGRPADMKGSTAFVHCSSWLMDMACWSGRAMNAAERETLVGLAEIVQRIDVSANLRYLNNGEVSSVLNADTYRYRGLVERGELARAAS